ncbi:LOW QUALITY PROTEIN: hypothetical protein KUTeg_016517 [Tegillarca granosa]|uniref:RING-type domain-containing protein n=1 Tax=Tegillarca granosa TaxID=220873 RepID=A0ABQ9EPW0_TEGGR|nr:LOW QUALITY PROTEIN: hypothetical protein KUTeg_016517 [Tegillarca granosa]
MSFCSTCKAKWHGSKTCDDVMFSGRQEDMGIPFSSAEDATIKRCPVCHVPIERNDGCAQMMCKRCKHVFCWYCLASLDDDFLLRHYDKGPCKNKLGHSRASVIWHRTQVVKAYHCDIRYHHVTHNLKKKKLFYYEIIHKMLQSLCNLFPVKYTCINCIFIKFDRYFIIDKITHKILSIVFYVYFKSTKKKN